MCVFMFVAVDNEKEGSKLQKTPDLIKAKGFRRSLIRKKRVLDIQIRNRLLFDIDN